MTDTRVQQGGTTPRESPEASRGPARLSIAERPRWRTKIIASWASSTTLSAPASSMHSRELFLID